MAQPLRSGEYDEFVGVLAETGYANLKFLKDELPHKDFDDASCILVQFSQALQAERHRPARESDFTVGNDGRSRRLFILRGMSSTVIERLGASLDIEPEFFNEHIQDTIWEHYADKTNAMMLPSVRHSALFWTIRYFEPIRFPGACLKFGQTHLIPAMPFRRMIIRSPHKDQGKEYYSVGLVSRFISFWCRKYHNGFFDGVFSPLNVSLRSSLMSSSCGSSGPVPPKPNPIWPQRSYRIEKLATIWRWLHRLRQDLREEKFPRRFTSAP